MIGTVLVANRGEIARRVMRICREMGIGTVAVYSGADADAPHVREADSAVRLPGDAPADSYLRGDAIVAAALAAGADAVHPGYGFLSENAEFAAAVLAAGLVWIGPPPRVVAAMGSKTRAKRLMAQAGVPVLDGTGAAAPLLVKASAGGGGRGMRIVRELADLEAQLAAARAEAQAAFGDGEVFVEPYVEDGRHVEVQILADVHGTVWTLGTRDCSVQRRHQKVIEETPAPGLRDLTERQLLEYADAAARAVGYVGAGTVEFLVGADGSAYFLEMNTRLQVEHPVTELVTGLDLVREQIRIAEGRRLPERPPVPHGHAVEARLYAEDPAHEWRPGTGVLHRFALPAGPGLRVDSGVADGSVIGVHYDAMLAKVAAYADTREEALRLLAYALRRAVLHGPVTNRDLLVRVLGDPRFVAGGVPTSYLEGLPPAPAPDGGALRLAALAAALADAAGRHPAGGWRNVPSQPQVKRFRAADGGEYEARYRLTRDGLAADDHPRVALVSSAPDRVVLDVGGVRREFAVARYGEAVFVDSAAGAVALTAVPRFPPPVGRTAPGSLLAPMPGTVVRVAGVAVGDRVTAGQPLLWLEAMKMEHRVTAPADGTLTALHAEPGWQVEVGAVLAVVSAAAAESAQA
ncbi:acetyl/propionyl/methylcrotonyl-CoA carboxylase subunit alpha [Streptantibioticus silvisoli]|uniref:Biotin carboxylase N-terminal domain-containing protein n=1 Tax=Streptantibioticus silvisoli TaxID=2705255 RepID=A0ABT6W8L9_9ACTN|nr:biotin carboxylase N-terminal domain-containing protein [Streptantibioticus silvisoli]MDI5967096.1 biotin carboxylase N-terminal domain-containing protein [Streptantibioticus silvisoli]